MCPKAGGRRKSAGVNGVAWGGGDWNWIPTRKEGICERVRCSGRDTLLYWSAPPCCVQPCENNKADLPQLCTACCLLPQRTPGASHHRLLPHSRALAPQPCSRPVKHAWRSNVLHDSCRPAA
jgi:hypothetical protein